MQSLMILGRQPALGLAELESLYGSNKIQPIGGQAAVVDVDPCLLAFERLGGSIKFCKVLTELNTVSWPEIQKFLEQTAPGQAKQMPDGKMRLGISAYGFKASPKQLTATALSIKKVVQASGRSVRVIPNNSPTLESAQVIHNKLTGPNGWELVIVRNGNKTIVAQTVKEQDIASYSLRDRSRPARDAKVGMLPPKLAQIIINLAVGELPEDKLESICEVPVGQKIPQPNFDQTILDPFCGTGVILQEAHLMGYEVYGTDLEARMIEYTNTNLRWLEELSQRHLKGATELADATTHVWREISFSVVATEAYLGRPFTSTPSLDVLLQTVSDCNLIIKKFLQNIYGQIKPGTRLCLAVPAWQTKPNEFKHMPLVDSLGSLGYNRISFERVRDDQLLYYREGQIVARQLLVLIRK